MLIHQFERVFATLLLFICKFVHFEQFLCKMFKKEKGTRSATTNFGKEEVLKIIIMITITISTSGDIDPIKLNNFGSINPISDIPCAQTCQFVLEFQIY